MKEYQALVAKVDGFVAGVSDRRRQDMRCGPGCAACCRVDLSLCPVEAESARQALSHLPDEAIVLLVQHAQQGGDRCPMLKADNTCSIYPARPLVCRTQGLPLQYPAGLLPADTVRVRTATGEVTWCPLNFTDTHVDAPDTLQAGRLDELLALVNHRYATAVGQDPQDRRTLRALLAERLRAPGAD